MGLFQCSGCFGVVVGKMKSDVSILIFFDDTEWGVRTTAHTSPNPTYFGI